MKLEMTTVENGTMVKKADHCNGGAINQQPVELATKQRWRPPRWSRDRLWLLALDVDHQGFRDGLSGCDGKPEEHRDGTPGRDSSSDYSGVCVLICAVIVPAATILGHSEWRSVDDHPKVLIMRNSTAMNFPSHVAEGVPMGVRVGSPVFPLTAQFRVLAHQYHSQCLATKPGPGIFAWTLQCTADPCVCHWETCTCMLPDTTVQRPLETQTSLQHLSLCSAWDQTTIPALVRKHDNQTLSVCELFCIFQISDIR